MELKYLWNLILRRKWIIIQAVVVILLVAVGVSLIIPDTYTSCGKIYDNYSQNTANSILDSLGLGDIASVLPSLGSTLIEDDVQKIRMRPYLEQLSSQLFLMDEEYNFLEADKLLNPGLKSKLKGTPSLSISNPAGTAIIEIQATSILPEEARQMVNTLAEIFIEQTMKRSREQYRSARLFVEEQLKSVFSRYNDVLNDLRLFQEKYGGLEISKEVGLAIDRLALLMTQMEDNKLELHEAEASLKNIEQQLNTQDNLIVTSRELKKNDLIQSLEQTIAELNLRYVEKSVEYREEHPEVKAIKKQIEEARHQLKEQITQVFGKEVVSLNPMYERLKTLYAEKLVAKSMLKIRDQVIPQIVEKYDRKLKGLPERLQEYSQLTLSQKVNEEVYKSLLSYKQSIGVAESMAISRLELVEPGSLPIIPSAPNRTLILILATFVGLVTGLGLAFIIDYFDDSIKDVTKVEELKDLHYLGFIPFIQPKKLAGQGTILSLKADSPIFEIYRSVRNDLRFVLEEKKAKTFIISSICKGEGKTTMACNLGLAFTKANCKVMIVDLDLRCPSVHRLFSLPNSQGVSSILMKHLDYHEVVQKVKYDEQTLEVITSGPLPSDVGILIESVGLQNLLQELMNNYDLLIIDTPPVLFLTDALIIGRFVKKMLWVMDVRAINLKPSLMVKNKLKEAGIDILGILENKKKKEPGDSYYGKYYDYQKYYTRNQ